MGALKKDMTHEEMADHLRNEVVGTAQYETGRLVEEGAPGFFGAVRAILCDLDYVAALYWGWDGQRRRTISTKEKSLNFLRHVFPAATKNVDYSTLAPLLYEMFRHGPVHLRAPKRFTSASASTGELGWGLMYAAEEQVDYEGSEITLQHLKTLKVNNDKTLLPVSIKMLFDDFLRSCEYFATGIEAEKHAGGTSRFDCWRQSANALVDPEPTNLVW